ncbi:MAG: helix-turn-helix domain-containing protein [Burkholderiaceae bacterium]
MSDTQATGTAEGAGAPPGSPLAGAAAGAPAGTSVGALLRAERERKGLHIGALAASLKMPVRKLEALEADRHAELTDAVFVRALALSVCRQLQADPQPILALLPDPEEPLLRTHTRLARVSMPVHEEFSPVAGGQRWLRRPLAWVVLALLLAALGFVFWPASGGDLGSVAVPAAPSTIGPAASPPADAAATPTTGTTPTAPPTPSGAAPVPTPGSTVTEPVTPAFPPGGAPAPAATATTPAAPVPSGLALLRLSASGASWIEVLDAGGAVLQRGNLQPGESVVANGPPPLKVTIGRADRVQVSVRGQPFDATPSTRDNVARFEVK